MAKVLVQTIGSKGEVKASKLVDAEKQAEYLAKPGLYLVHGLVEVKKQDAAPATEENENNNDE